MNSCGPLTLEVGPVLALVLVQMVTLGVTAVAALNARTAATRAADTLHQQNHLTASIQNLGPQGPEIHKET